MVLGGSIFWKVKTGYSGFFRYPGFAPLLILVTMTIIILSALDSEAFATDSTAGARSNRATAIASAQIVRPFALTTQNQSSADAQNSEIIVSRNTTYRDCDNLLGTDTDRGRGESCVLHLIELQ